MKNITKEMERLESLCALFGPSGCEGEVADWIEARVRPLCDGVCRDRMGNLLCLVRMGDVSVPCRRKVMISAHMDEVGFMITEICEDGLLRFDTVGGIDVSVLEGRKVILGDEINRVPGIIASKAIHHKKREERNKSTPIRKLFIDIGAASREEAEALLSVGSFGTFDSEFYRFGKDGAYLKAKALDDRIGCAAMMRVMESLRENPCEGNLDLYFCFTVREEIGCAGALVAAQRIKPEISIVLEGTTAADLADMEESRQVVCLGKGGALSFMDRATVYDRPLLEFALALAKEQGIPTQIKQLVAGGNDSGAIHKSGEGTRPMVISVPTRYLHSASCVAHISDFLAVGDLCEALLRHMDTDRP